MLAEPGRKVFFHLSLSQTPQIELPGFPLNSIPPLVLYLFSLLSLQQRCTTLSDTGKELLRNGEALSPPGSLIRVLANVT